MGVLILLLWGLIPNTYVPLTRTPLCPYQSQVVRIFRTPKVWGCGEGAAAVISFTYLSHSPTHSPTCRIPVICLPASESVRGSDAACGGRNHRGDQGSQRLQEAAQPCVSLRFGDEATDQLWQQRVGTESSPRWSVI